MKDDRVYLLHVQDAAERIADYTREGRESFLADRKTQDAVLRNIEVIGEAVKNLSNAVRTAHPDVPWRQIAGMRHIMVHDYFKVDWDIVYTTATIHVPALKPHIEAMLNSLPPEAATP